MHEYGPYSCTSICIYIQIPAQNYEEIEFNIDSLILLVAVENSMFLQGHYDCFQRIKV